MNTDKKAYVLTAGGGDISAALAKLCANGEIGESLVRNGVTQDAFCLFLAKLAKSRFDAGKSESQVADIFRLVSGGNSSAARQALAKCKIRFEDDPPVSPKAPEYMVGEGQNSFWDKAGGGKSSPNLSMLDL